MEWLKYLTFAKFEFTIQAAAPLILPQFKGSTLRGAFGNIFQNVVCIKEDRKCGTCILTQHCSYYYIFETPNSGDRFPWFSSPKLPHPYVIEPPEEERERFAPGEELRFNLILFGRAIDYLPYFIFVFDEMGRRGGIGKFRNEGFGRFELVQVRDVLAQGRVIYDGQQKMITAAPEVHSGADLLQGCENINGGKITLNFMTPTRIKHNGKYLLFKANQEFAIEALLENLYRRAFLMTFGHCCDDTRPFKLPDFTNVQVENMNLHWRDWQRYSNRQQRRHHFGGFLGRIVLAGDFAPWLPLLKAGELLHAGSATSFGLGKYQVKW